MSLVTVSNLCKYYGEGDSMVKAVRDISFTLEKQDFIALQGPSGSGKSTLLAMLAGLLNPSSGSVNIDGINLYSELNSDGLARFRSAYTGFVFQAFNLISYLTTLENVMLPLAPLAMSGKEKVQRAKAALEKVGLSDREGHLPGELSGGQQQRAAIARGIVNEPVLLFADEPTGNLDSKTKMEIMDLFRDLNNAGHTIIMVTHEKGGLDHIHRTLSIEDGRLCARQSSQT